MLFRSKMMAEQLLKFTMESEASLPQAARKLIDFAGKETIWTFFGEMGAGKTTLIRELCHQWGVTSSVSSPTFSIVNEYNSPSGPLFHFDFYRIEKESEAINIGCEEYFDSGSICLIEWPEKILNLLPKSFLAIHIESNGRSRMITAKYDG